MNAKELYGENIYSRPRKNIIKDRMSSCCLEEQHNFIPVRAINHEMEMPSENDPFIDIKSTSYLL